MTSAIGSFLDIALELFRFQRENRDFFISCLKMSRGGVNRIKWSRTISCSVPVIEGNVPKYIVPFNRNKTIDLQDELLTIYYSILWRIHETFGFSYPVDIHYSTLDRRQFDKYCNGLGLLRLKQIRGKYFSDRAVRLWQLCYAYFSESRDIHVNALQAEYLLVSHYDRVFEDMIDVLLSDDKARLPRVLTAQHDRKELDHIYQYKGLISSSQDVQVYIGDSKYYKQGEPASEHDEHKQYTYARNVIQENLRVFLDGGEEQWSGYRVLWDSDTEGYNLMPNFFISACVYPGLDFENSNITHLVGSTKMTRHFDNRLFDRDTLIVSKYDINFLYVLSRYVRHGWGDSEKYRRDIRERFANDIRDAIQSKFKIYGLRPHIGMTDFNPIRFFAENIKSLIGKIFNPYKGHRYDGMYYALALREDVPEFEFENSSIKNLLSERFYLFDCPLGCDPAAAWGDYYAAHDELHHIGEMPVG